MRRGVIAALLAGCAGVPDADLLDQAALGDIVARVDLPALPPPHAVALHGPTDVPDTPEGWGVTRWADVPGPVTIDDDGRIAWPPGTTLWRLERGPDGGLREAHGLSIDARGARTALLVAGEGRVDGPFAAAAWALDDGPLDPHRASTLAAVIAQRSPWLGHGAAGTRAAALDIERTADCGACHAPNQPAATRAMDRDGMTGPTDASGSYAGAVALADHAPLPLHGTTEVGRAPGVRVTCPGGDPVEVTDARGVMRLRCPGGFVPAARRDRPDDARCAMRRALSGVPIDPRCP